ncbi:hypothetical protein ACWEQL_22660 [Kitasatospora sp. NPDC004240]
MNGSTPVLPEVLLLLLLAVLSVALIVVGLVVRHRQRARRRQPPPQGFQQPYAHRPYPQQPFGPSQEPPAGP